MLMMTVGIPIGFGHTNTMIPKPTLKTHEIGQHHQFEVLAFQSNFHLLESILFLMKIGIFTKCVVKWLKCITEQK